MFKHCYADFSSSLKNEEYYSEFCSNWLLTILRVSCYYKMGLEDVDWSKKKEIDSVEFQEGNKDIWSQLGRELTIGSAFTSVKVIHDYIFRSIYSKESVEQASLQYYNIVEKTQLDSTDPLKVDLGDYYIQKDEKVLEGIRRVEDRLYSGKYRPEQYHRVLSMLCILQSTGFDIKIDEYVSYMKQHLNDEPMENDVKSILGKKEGWGKELKDYAIGKFMSDVVPYSKVIAYASSKEWSDLLINAEAEDIHDFRLLVTGRSILGEKEAEILQEIQQNVQNKLDQDPPDSKIVAMQLRWLVGNIKEKLGQSKQ